MVRLTDRSVNLRMEVRRMANEVTTRLGPLTSSDTGEGPVVVLLHATLHDRHDFDAVAPSLSRRQRVIALDWPGHRDCRLPAPTDSLTAAALADALEDVVGALDSPAAAFVGNSVGGFAAARLAITNPERVSRLVLVNTGGFAASALTNLYCRAVGTPAVTRLVLPRLIRSYMRSTSDTDREIEKRALARARTPEGAALAAALWRSFAAPEYDLRPQANRITAPTLIVWGSKDTAIPLRFGRATAAAIPGSRLEVLPTGHLPFSSDPDGFLAIAAPFLATATGLGTAR